MQINCLAILQTQSFRAEKFNKAILNECLEWNIALWNINLIAADQDIIKESFVSYLTFFKASGFVECLLHFAMINWKMKR